MTAHAESSPEQHADTVEPAEATAAVEPERSAEEVETDAGDQSAAEAASTPADEDAAVLAEAGSAATDDGDEPSTDDVSTDDTSGAEESSAVDEAPAAEALQGGEVAEGENAPSADTAPASPAPAPKPTPGPRPIPRPSPRPAVVVPHVAPAAEAPSAATTAADAAEWGRVADDGTVSVREGDGWREVGQYPDGTPDEALAYFARKFADLADKVALLEQRHRGGGASAGELRTAAARLSGEVDGAAAVGDLGGLTARLTALTEALGAASEAEQAAAREAVEQALTQRTELVERIEALAARDPKSIQWKQASAEVSALFDEWQSQQQHGPRLPKSASQQLWKRFRDARAILDRHRREFYAELDETHKAARDRKTRLVEKAEALAPKGEDGIPSYRDLLDQWKGAGRAGKKVDDALWARFKAAGDALYGARAARDAEEAEASREKIEQRRALLVEAKAVGDEKDIAKARALLTGIQRRWDEVGRIFPRDKERALDDDLRKIEQALKTREDADWKGNNPETKARANDMTRQLSDAIAKLEAELAAARQAGDKKAAAAAEEALSARKAWLAALGD